MILRILSISFRSRLSVTCVYTRFVVVGLAWPIHLARMRSETPISVRFWLKVCLNVLGVNVKSTFAFRSSNMRRMVDTLKGNIRLFVLGRLSNIRFKGTKTGTVRTESSVLVPRISKVCLSSDKSVHSNCSSSLRLQPLQIYAWIIFF